MWLEGEVKTPPFTRAARLEVGYLLRRLQKGESLTRIIQCAVKSRRLSVGANPTRQLVAPAGSNRSGGGGNESVEASGVEGP